MVVPESEKRRIEERGEIDEAAVSIDETAVSSMIETAKESEEATEKLTSIVMESLDISKFRERLVEEALRDPELRNKIMLELIKKL